MLKYNALLWALSAPLIIFTFGQALRRGGLRYALQRLGLTIPSFTQRPLWLHAASVGEVIAALPLMERLRSRYPDATLVISTTTATGAAVAAARLPADFAHVYLPIDWRGAVTRFLRAMQPRCALIMETELWPNLYHRCNATGIPLLLINGRLSARTLHAGAWMRHVYSATLAQVDAVLARSETDRAAFIELGTPPSRVIVIGNIKFSAATHGAEFTPTKIDRPYVLAASTHDDEEIQLAHLWQNLARKDHLLVIAPRHPRSKTHV